MTGLWRCGILALAVLAATPAFAAAKRKAPPPPPPMPQRNATAFYGAYLKLHPSGIPDAATRRRLMPYLTDRLYGLLQEGERAEARYAEATRHESPPLIEGDMFSSMFEGATSFTLTDCKTEAEMARCEIALTYVAQGQPDTHWTDSVLLQKVGRRYRIDDIEYGGNWPFANKGKLSDVLTDAIAQSRMPDN